MVISMKQIIRMLKRVAIFVALCFCMFQLIEGLKLLTARGLDPLYATDRQTFAGSTAPLGEDVGIKKRLLLYYWLGE